jgi:hypothetical protein
MDHIEFPDGPVIHVIIFKTFADKEIAEELAKVGVFRLVVKSQSQNMVEIPCKCSHHKDPQLEYSSVPL